ncbi:TPA: pore-forming cytotoxin subunit YaxA [Yersinia enterocolitica]|uniref:pore-forming cytotoxin subunit YaxA n=1 Tax=Yersinia enterocolitica TaxID=630 RepID=UPI00094BA0B6|nr:pore-forming cytotoxin subunit YaxA [Yersinia enterocolitica]MBW5832033.1 pore-forming cytotoxin subunit YaxA [Yersinia enterocolitica]MBX9473809.1 pore-forming cytotoxin subunit YaxA [Yersinia enterocolitica]MBX9488723.1 pore-forming cytotoxin subunit YaxA [Yersinia enterocolitica]MBX9492717.1 pore-forming cytotoxin subunit YaxA [Yersinia enterocolitica]HDL8052793.1 pore-forming cytotoxin subunit YaxA [Yersinia enterocolitica]
MTQIQLAIDNNLASAESTIQLNELPKVVLDFITGEQTGVARSGGIFTKEDLINLKLYVRKGLSLPTQQDEVTAYLGYKKIDVAGLEPKDIKLLFDGIHNHALNWNDVEQAVLQQSLDLDIAAKNIISTSNEIISLINQMPITVRVKTMLGDITDQQLENITYESADHEVASALKDILDEMKVDINRHQATTANVRKKVSDYRITLTGGELSSGDKVNGLEPQVKTKYDLMEKNNMRKSIKELDEKIKEKRQRIEQLKKDYDKFVGLSFTGAVSGIIAIAIAGGIFGAKAENARKEKNALISEVAELESKVSSQRALQTALEALSLSFSDIGIRMVDAESALNHLDFMWLSVLNQITESQTQFATINNALRLTSFVNKFQQVITPWKSVGDSARQLVDIFDEAIKEYKKVYG